ncbi:MAG: RNA polymerase sigma factor region1.1 domain-containing protein, partial [Planctomycetota bacterium]|nr:RNA polymerase sigma factor region1.1 domain-containing protein [Planctomycetota bacterium]
MAKKGIKANKPGNEPQESLAATEKAKEKKTEDQIEAIIEKGKKKGFLTYEEMNEDLPEDAISPNRLDSLLATLDEIG